MPHYGWFAVGCCALILSSVAIRVGLPIVREQSAISELRQRDRAQVITVARNLEWLDRAIGSRWTKDWAQARVVVVDRRHDFTDRELKYVANLPQLQDLDIGGTRVSDQGLASLRGLAQLQRLNLQDTEITDRGLEHLKTLTNLGVVTLQGSRVTPAGVEALGKSLPSTMIVGP